MLKLLEFDYSIEYKKGTEKSVADALSQKVDHYQKDQCMPMVAMVPK
jgi:hypothetical protein